MKVHYIGNYIDTNSFDIYQGNIPGRLKMEYIITKLKRLDCHVMVLSLCKTKSSRFTRRKKKLINQLVEVQYVSTFGSNKKISNIMNFIIINAQLILYVLKIKRNDSIILYHSYYSTKILYFLKKIKKLNVIIEVEEIYGYSATKDLNYVEKEKKYIKGFDKYLFVNDLLPIDLNLTAKPHFICYGVCEIPKGVKISLDKNYVHVVYAGTIETRKKGAFSAIECSKYLPENYKVHILGFGIKDAIDLAKKMIYDINNLKKRQVVEFHGFLQGQELTDFLISCDIGLSTYVMRDSFSKSVFPSKLITYAVHNLKIVTGYSEVIEKSIFSEICNYYYEHSPEAISKAILQVDLSNWKSNNLDRILDCDSKLSYWLKENL
ncbi:MAG: hypothetical protein AB7V16_10695 [Vulcanibacillus sp.]